MKGFQAVEWHYQICFLQMYSKVRNARLGVIAVIQVTNSCDHNQGRVGVGEKKAGFQEKKGHRTHGPKSGAGNEKKKKKSNIPP